MKLRALFLILIFLPKIALAQEEKPVSPPITPPVLAPAEATAPYDDKMQRLAEVLGSIHYLRSLCGADEGSKWRDIMGSLIESERPGPKRKARLIARFNRGYRAFDESYSSCTSSAILAAERYMHEGELLAGQITGRYGR